MIKIKNLYKEFDGKPVANGINLAVPAGQMACIIGKSGQGKSVLLKQIAGLVAPTSGNIIINGIETVGTDGHATLQKNGITLGYVFQFAALLDSLTVYENVGITLLEQGYDCTEVEKIVREYLELVQLKPSIMSLYPSQLSGGMQKRVGLARTLVSKPSIMLYDEPTTGLDPITTRAIHELMADMQRTFGLTSIVVTHDVSFFEYADTVALLDDGQIKCLELAAEAWSSSDPYMHQFIRGLCSGPMM